MTQDEFNQVMWGCFLLWAYDDADTHAAFSAATGLVLTEPRDAIARLVDNATGYRASVLDRYVEWVTETLWGLEFAPKAYQDELAKRRRGVTT